MQDIQKYPTVTSLQIQQADPSLEKEKTSIYSHPLYPLLSLLLEQCDQATSSPDSQAPDTFEADLQSYIQRHEGNDKMFFTDNKDLDSLIVKAIQVLRIHLNELRKVNELCRDFCTRYINCLKTKIHQDSMFDDSDDSSPNGSERLSPNVLPGAGSTYNSPYSCHGGTIGRNYIELGHNQRHQHMMGQLHNMGHNCNSALGGISVDCMDYMNGTNSSPPLSGISIHDDLTNNNYLTSATSANSGAYSNLLDPSKQKRGVLPKKATQIMKQWLFQHLVHPYPTEDEKRQIANQTNLTLLQVNNWFINARRRILQPMLDNGSSPGKEKSANVKLDKSDSVSESEETGSGLMYNSSCGNRKKKAATNRPSNNRFWPASLAAAVNILSIHPSMSNGTTNSPIATIPSERTTPKIISQEETTEQFRSRKRSKSHSSDIDVYQPPKVFSSSKEQYESYITELEYKSHEKETKSQSDTSTPQYTELSSPNNSKSNSLDGGERTKSEPLSLTLNTIPNTVHTSPKFSQESSKKNSMPETISSYLSSTSTFNVKPHDIPSSVNLFPPNPSPYMPTNPYANIMMPQANSYLNHPAMFYNSSLQRNDPNPMSSSLFGMRHPNPHSFPMYDSIYPNYEHLIDKRTSMASHINDLFAAPHGFCRSWEDHKSSKTLSQYSNIDNPQNVVIKNEFMSSLPEPGPMSSHSYPHLETFPNLKAFHSKTNTN